MQCKYVLNVYFIQHVLELTFHLVTIMFLLLLRVSGERWGRVRVEEGEDRRCRISENVS